MKSKIVIALLLLVSLSLSAQKKVTWEDLAKVSFVDKYFKDYEQSFLYPVFSESVKKIEGEKITISGYFLSLDPQGAVYMLSKGPMAACFFCGIGGPETAMELQFKEEPEFETDDIITVTGVLKLNKDDVEHFNYILQNVEAKKADD
ncbi:MAG: hypothetical protein CMB99_05870 [Flavobacteriaceae bacterium]|nr:hypothetical protein [Flavobacteriaceae bacterium]|tara:strand:+ start:8207 stop:8647 length:441 start_codon:yes stop_codon:yes gene_type:complete